MMRCKHCGFIPKPKDWCPICLPSDGPEGWSCGPDHSGGVRDVFYNGAVVARDVLSGDALMIVDMWHRLQELSDDNMRLAAELADLKSRHFDEW